MVFHLGMLHQESSLEGPPQSGMISAQILEATQDTHQLRPAEAVMQVHSIVCLGPRYHGMPVMGN